MTISFNSLHTTTFAGRSILSVTQFNLADLALVFAVADKMRTVVQQSGAVDLLKGKLITNLFYEPSTRTSSSFSAAVQRLGGSVIQINNVQFSSVSKGETLPDTIRTLASYSDAIVLRHHETGAAATAAQFSPKPIINAGDGIGEHPTQALLDLFTIRQELGQLHGLTVTMLGDLKYGRTVHSLAQLLALYGAKIHYVSPNNLRMPDNLLHKLTALGCEQSEHQLLDDVLPNSDVLYVTRVQKERFADLSEYEAVKDCYVVTPQTLTAAKQKMVVMHPLPRVNEISLAVDTDPRAAYFRQMENGMYVRMAIMALVFGWA